MFDIIMLKKLYHDTHFLFDLGIKNSKSRLLSILFILSKTKFKIVGHQPLLRNAHSGNIYEFIYYNSMLGMNNFVYFLTIS